MKDQRRSSNIVSASNGSLSAAMGSQVSRRDFFKIAGITGASLTAAYFLSGCSGSSEPAASSGAEALPETDTVVIGVYSGDWEKNINQAALDAFAAETGLNIEIVAGADAEWVTKLQAANGKNVPYDLLILQPDSIQKLIDGNLLQSLTVDNVPEIANLYTSINDRFTSNGELYAAGFSMGQLGICYRTDLVEKAPSSWAELWDAEYAGKLGISPLTYSAGLQFFWSQTAEGADVEGAFTKMVDLKPNIAAYPDGAGSIQTLIQRGDIAMVPFWDGRAFAWQKAGEPIGFAYPSDGPVAAIASWVIPQNAPNLANAYKLLNFLCSAEVQSTYGELSYYGMSNKNAEYSEEFLSKANVGEEFYNQLDWVDYSVVSSELADWSAHWQEIMQ